MTRKERKKRPVWNHFNSLSRSDVSHPHVQCIYCSKEFQRAIPERMQVHLDKKCPNAPNNAKSQSSQLNITTSVITNNINDEIARKKGPVWENFYIIDKYEDSHPNVQCKFCFKEFKRAVPQRMKTHIEKCSKAPNNAKSKYNQNISKINNIKDCMSDEEQKSLESLLAKALSSAEIHFSFVDNPFVIEFFNRLKPSFKLPNGEEIKIQMSQFHNNKSSMNDIEYYDHEMENAIITFEEASENDDLDSMYNLECYYKDEIGTEKNEIEAFELYKKAAEKAAAEKGVLGSIYKVGMCYRYGIGTEINVIKSFEYYNRAKRSC
ncbi:kinase-like domain-containing protein [Rhizophagus clarus]|uniref:Kinase-like domain-containing protein n=1 Tax=Rhizophagus clarus TaxID=94130 RepID=A0A8H3QSY1_9GLOM|nr:kinase-like domain-containing protein [Rhizophagus clarus]